MVLAYIVIPESVALVVGKKMGKHNFSYFISPKKTWEGFCGQLFGIVGSILAMMFFDFVIGMNTIELRYDVAFAFGLVMIPISILGDLMESILKRALGIKDSSEKKIIGALGGLLDKFDSLGVGWMLMAAFISVFNPEHHT